MAAGTPSCPAAGLLQRDAAPQFGSCGPAVTGVRNAPAAIEEGRQRAIQYVQAARTVLTAAPRRGTDLRDGAEAPLHRPERRAARDDPCLLRPDPVRAAPGEFVCEGDRNRCGSFQAGWLEEDDMIHICRPFFPLNTTCRAIVLVHEAAHDADVDAAETGHPPYRGWSTYPVGAEAPVVPVTTRERMANPDAYAYFAAHVWRDTDTGICTTPRKLTGRSSSSASTAGSRRIRLNAAPDRALCEHDVLRALEDLQAPVGDELLVDRAEAALERRPDGRAERDGLAVHRAAGGHDEVGEGDQRLRVDRALRDDEAAAGELGALLRRARQHDGLAPSSRSSTPAKTSFSKR